MLNRGSKNERAGRGNYLRTTYESKRLRRDSHNMQITTDDLLLEILKFHSPAVVMAVKCR
jgi:hypothetical protein